MATAKGVLSLPKVAYDGYICGRKSNTNESASRSPATAISTSPIAKRKMINDSTVSSRYSDEDLAQFREVIMKKLSRAQDDLEFYKDSMQEMADSPESKVKGLDDGTGSAEIERLNNLAGRQQKLIRHLEAAVARIDNKVYGVCRETGNLIPKQRLLAVPHATLSMEAKMAR